MVLSVRSGAVFGAWLSLVGPLFSASELSALPDSVDLRPRFEKWGLGPREQGGRPTCSVFTVVGAMEYAVAEERQQGERLSVEYLNWAANDLRRRARDGGFFFDIWRGFQAHGICLEDSMPYGKKFDPAGSPETAAREGAKRFQEMGLQIHWIKRWNVRTGLSEEQFQAIKETLAQGWPVCAGLRWPKKEVWQEDVLQMSEDVFDGHSILVVGYREDDKQPGGGVLIFRNTSRGGRDGFMPFGYAKRFVNDALWIESKRPE